MLSAFLVSLREGVEAALIVGLCLAYLRKINRGDLERPVWYGVGAALLASLAAAALMERFAWNEESVEGFLMLFAAVLLISMIVWMRRVARSLRGEIENQVGRLASRERLAALGLFLFVFSMVLREGIETVIFLRAVSLNTEGILLVVGTLLGLALAVVMGLFFFQGTLPIRLDRFFDATSIMLWVIAVQLVLTGLHELSEAFIIPSGPGMMRVLGPIVRNDVFFSVVLLGVAAWLVARELLRRRHALPIPVELDPAQLHRRRQQKQREGRWMTATAITAFVVLVALTTEYVYARTDTEFTPALPVQAASDTIRLPLAQVNDGSMHHFRFTDGGTTIRFLVLRRPDGRLATALEACTICGAHGYAQEGENVVCKNCAAEIPVSHIDAPGGCNPVPVGSHVEDEELVISVSELLGGAHFFERP